MDLIETIKQRKSIRHFRPEHPSRALLQECLEAATWAPNPTTQQPWKFIVLSGDALAKVAGVIETNFSSAQKRISQEPVPTVSEESRTLLEGMSNVKVQISNDRNDPFASPLGREGGVSGILSHG